jgi:hypothetical protein
MGPHIDKTRFGAITVAGQVFRHDISITLDGQVIKRKSHLSQSQYGTSHKISLDEIRDLWEPGASHIVIGAGLFRRVHLSSEAADFLSLHHCAVEVYSTRRAIRHWNEMDGSIIGLFHVTC